MKRLDFLKKGFGVLGVAAAAPLVNACSKSTVDTASSSSSSTSGSTNTSCASSAVETAGPFPTITPSSLVKSDITGDRTGVPLTIKITVQNKNNNCGGLSGALVDIWHCDKDGNYSEYGGSAMQTTNYTSVHFLRGRQVTDSTGLVTFTSIFPGWYSGRATHIHVHIYNAAGTSLVVTQIAFPEATDSAVVAVNAATAKGYTKGMTGYTYNASDNVFSDGTSTEMSSLSGSVSAGYVLNFIAVVSA